MSRRRATLEQIAYGEGTTPSERLKALELLRELEPVAPPSPVVTLLAEMTEDVLDKELDGLMATAIVAAVETDDGSWPVLAGLLRALVEKRARELADGYRLPLLVLDHTGMRVGELEALTWGDMDESKHRWRVSAAVSKTGRTRWIEVPPILFEAVMALVARDDRTPERRVVGGFGADRFRTAITRACTAAAIPTFSPHDLRHRRVSLLHLAGMPWARIGELVGHGDIVTTARTYTHVVADEAELDYAEVLR